MNESEVKDILNDPKKLLDLFRLFHQLIHVYEAQEIKKQAQKSQTPEFMGLSDSIDIKVIHSDKIQKEVQ